VQLQIKVQDEIFSQKLKKKKLKNRKESQNPLDSDGEQPENKVSSLNNQNYISTHDQKRFEHNFSGFLSEEHKSEFNQYQLSKYKKFVRRLKKNVAASRHFDLYKS
jgi:hypothetical protein